MILIFFFFWIGNKLFEKLASTTKVVTSFLSKLFNLIISSFSFDKWIKILENVLAL